MNSPLAVLSEKLIACFLFVLVGRLIYIHAETIANKIGMWFSSATVSPKVAKGVRAIGVFYVVFGGALVALFVFGIVAYLTHS